jgi:LysM repeat protein
VLGGLAGCSRPATVREGGSPTSEAASSDESMTPAAGQTVVSAVTSTPTAVMVAVEEQRTETVEQPAVGASATPEPTATEASESTSVSDEQAVVHVVKQGETLSSIAEQYETTVEAIRATNDLGETDVIVPGQELTISTSSESAAESSGDSTAESTKESSSQDSSGCSHQHKVKKGEWIWQIARDYDVSPYRILEANNLSKKEASIIHPGDVLCIP